MAIKKKIRIGLVYDLLIAAGVIGFLFVAGFFIWFSLMSLTLPAPEIIGEKISGGGTQIYDRTGKILLYEIGARRVWVGYNQIPEKIILTTLAAEDAEFFYHKGVSFKGIVRAFWLNLKSTSFGYGGSTITQQLARNLFLDQSKNVSRKIKELMLALDLERKYSKDEILAFYLNTINFGEGNYGVAAAADFYFDKNLNDLTWSEAAALMSIPRSPFYYSPGKKENIERLLKRREQILRNLNRLGWLAEQTYAQALKEKLNFTGKKYAQIIAPHFVLEVKTILERMFPKTSLERENLRVVTSLNYDLQKLAQGAVEAGVKENERKYGGRNAALLAADASTGEILAMVGSRNFNDVSIDGQVNMTFWPRQPGSAFKPFSYVTLFQLGYPTETIVFDLPTNFGNNVNPYRPKNFDKKFRGPVSLRQALAESLNIPAVKVFYLADPERVIANTRKFGVTTLGDYKNYGLSLGLGTAELRMIDLVKAYGVFANDGELTTQTLILKITNATGKALYTYQPKTERVIDSQSIRLLNDTLKDRGARSGLFGASLPLTNVADYEIALKTGTSENYRDAWVFGYSPNLVVAVWSGNTSGKPMKAGGASLVASLPIWHGFIQPALSRFPKAVFPEPLPRKINKPMLNGQWSTPFGVHSILFYTDRFNPFGLFPARPENDPQFSNWEEPVKAWLINLDDGSTVIESDESGSNFLPTTQFP